MPIRSCWRTYEIVCSKYPDANVGKAVKAFLTSALGNGQNGLEDDGYIPIPDTIQAAADRRR